jgi:hypothetical protein
MLGMLDSTSAIATARASKRSATMDRPDYASNEEWAELRKRRGSNSEPPPSPPPLGEPILSSGAAILKAYPLHWDSDDEAEPKAPELVEGMLPEVGVALAERTMGTL